MNKYIISLIIFFVGLAAHGTDVQRVHGVVRDSLTHQPVPFATVFLVGTERGMLTDDHGVFDISTARQFDRVRVTAMGYNTVEVPARHARNLTLNIDISPIGVQLAEVVAKPKKEKYSKKDNPAVAFMEKIRANRDLNNPRQKDNYNFDKYERITVALNNFHGDDTVTGTGGAWMLKQFPFLAEHIDTSEVSGNPILNVIAREKAARVHFRKEPRSEKEEVLGVSSAGFDEMFDRESMLKLYEDVLREIDVYQNDIPVFQNRFVSPLSKIAPDFYKFYLTDTVMVDTVRCVELTFVPHNSASFGFTGKLYVPEGDSTMFIRRIVMYVPHEINLNFVEQLHITQDYERAPDGTRLKVRDDMVVEAAIIPGMPGIYARRNTNYANHDFATWEDQKIFKKSGSQVKTAGADDRDEEFWTHHRLSEISKGEKSVKTMMQRLRQSRGFYWTEKIIKILVSGYIPTSKKSKIDIGPMNTTVSFNEIEGLRLRAGAITTANLSRRWFSRFFGAYGFKDHKWKYLAELEYSFRDKNYHSREWPVQSLRATSLYDVDMLGQHYMFTNPDNVFLSLKRKKDYQMTYHRVQKLEWIMEFENNFSFELRAENARQISTPYMPFINGRGRQVFHYTTNSATLQLRYAPGEKFYQSKTYRFPINLDAPVFTLSHTLAPRGFLGNEFTINKTEFSFQKRVWLSAFGYIDGIIKTAHVWSRVPYPNLIIPNANLSYTIQPESFPLLNPMEFMMDTYAQWDLTYWANGALFNLIPAFKRLKLREAFSFRGFFGHLSDRNRPSLNPELFRFPAISQTQEMAWGTPYMEAGVGVDNIFKILRLDYVWRLTYRDNPGACLGGLRLALHFTF